MIAQGNAALQAALTLTRNGLRGPMTLQAAIAAEHCRAVDLRSTDWSAIVELYSELLSVQPSPTLALGRCIAIAQLVGPAAGLADLDEVIDVGGLEQYPYAFGARAQLLAALGRNSEAAQEWTAAARWSRTEAEREYFAAEAARAGDLSERTAATGQ